MRITTLVLVAIYTVCAVTVWAGGRRDNESHEADNPSGFTASVDTSEKAQGKYNFYIEARDRAGNAASVGPENIYIDPESDLPAARIVNPGRNMRVSGNLNIVGICADDDGVGYVEIVVTRGAYGNGETMLQTRAQGTEFWSYFLDTTDPEKWTDGTYTVAAWGVDSNGLSGISDAFPPRARRKHQVSWHLDRKKPETRVTSHETGALVAGKIRLRGTVFDGNGVEFFGYSTDGGVRYLPASLKYDRRNDLYHWDIQIDTRIFEDGPAVIWFKAKDGAGTEGAAAHLLFANNTGPDARIVYPDPDEAVNGVFTVAGYAGHPVGLRSVTWRLGRESGELPLLEGNPWWAKEFDIRGLRATSLNLEIRAVDLTGNVTTVRRKLKVDQNADLPRINLEEPAAGAVLAGEDLVVKGTAVDDDGAASIFYSVDSSPAIEIPCSGSFQFSVPGLSAGIHTLEIWAVDITGVRGPTIKVKGIAVPGPLPEPRLAAVRVGSGRALVSNDFYTGIEIIPGPKTVMEFTVKSAVPIIKSSVRFGDSPEITVNAKPGRDGLYRADIPVSPDMGNGLTKIELRAIDKYGREGVWEEYVYIGPTGGRSFEWIRTDKSPGNGRILISRETLIGLGSALLQKADISGEGAGNFRISVDQYGRAILTADGAEGNFGPLSLTLTNRDGETFTSGPFYFLADFAPPALSAQAAAGEWARDSVPVKFSFSDANKITSADFSLDAGVSWQPLLNDSEIAGAGSGQRPVGQSPVGQSPEGQRSVGFERTLDISSINEGALDIFIRVTDEANRYTVKKFTVRKDTQPPEARLIAPVSQARVNGTIRLCVALREAGCLKSITYARPAAGNGEIPAISKKLYPHPALNYPSTFFDVLLDSREMPLDENMVFIFEDQAGNVSELKDWHFIIDRETDVPAAHISLPLENEVITGDFIVSGVAYDDDAIKQIYWRMDDGEEQTLAAENGFSIPIAISGMTNNEHSVTIVAEDIYGVKSAPVTRNFRVSLAEPMATMTSPGIETIIRDTARITGAASDLNGIEKVRVSLDNGNTYNDANGAIGDDGANSDEWSYAFNSKIFEDGPHVVFIQVEDKYGVSAVYSSLINIDNTPPAIVLDAPLDGNVTTGYVFVSGSAADLNLDRVVIKVRSLAGAEVPEWLKTLELESGPIVMEQLDLSGMEDGLYNIEVWALDKAKNITRISRNVELARESRRNFVDILYPLEGEHVQGVFNLYGETGGIDKAKAVTLALNGRDIDTVDVTGAGYFRFSLSGEQLEAGLNRLTVSSDFGGAEKVESPARAVLYRPDGAWVTIDSLNMGDFAYDRPWFSGRAGYVLGADDEEIMTNNMADKALKEQARAKALDYIDISFDNGNTFIKTDKGREKGVDWRYRLETGEMTEGIHYIIVRANMKNGETALTRTLIQVDKTPPVIRLVAPQAGGRYNAGMEFTALASDDVALNSVSYHLRKGDKAAYEVPGFIQGLYFEATIPPFIKQMANETPALFSGGATYMDIGMGLSFFNDNVKLQVQYGFMTQGIYASMGGTDKLRFGGHVLGFKLLANVYTLPFGSIAGPDWDWLFASFALGANFSLFDFTGQGYTQSGSPTWLSAMVGQIEFPRVTIPKRTYLRTFSFFTEGQLWFVSTDVDASANNVMTVIPHVVVGLRMNIF